MRCAPGFAQLPAPRVPELARRWDGVFASRPRLRRLTAAIAAVSPLRGWCGREIGPSGQVRNRVRRGGVGEPAGRSAGLLTQSASHRCRCRFDHAIR
jgi:hypothetical protein